MAETTPSTSLKTKSRLSRSYPVRLRAAELLLDATEADPEILAAMERFSYNKAKRDEGRNLLQVAQGANQTGPRARSAQRSATDRHGDAEKAVRRASSDLSAICRAAFVGDKATLIFLGLDRPEPRSLPEYLSAAQLLYDGAVSGSQAMRDTLAAFGYPRQRLLDERERINTLRQTDTQQEAAKSATQEATPERLAAFRELDAWTAQFRKVARIALRDRPEKLVALGLG